MERVNKLIRLLIIVLYVYNDNVYAAPSQKLANYFIPEKRPLKKALGYLEDTYLNFTELTDKYGYPTEQHDVITEDGYILTVFRILTKCNGYNRGFPVVLLHGIYDSSDLWILTGPDSALGYILANNCYDVWAANHRGNVYSRRHIWLDPNKDPAFWDFTFDEHGNYDVPAIVDYVLSVTQKPKVNYIGHSQGTTDFFVMASLKPEYNDKVQISFHLAPIAWMKHLKSPIPKLTAPASGPAKAFLDDLGYSEIFAKHQIFHHLLEFLCQYAPDEICGTGYSILTGYKQGNISSKTLKIAFGHLFVGISTKDLDHFGQLVTSGRFQRYDYGRRRNKKEYNSVIPPEYDVSRISSAVVLISGQNDWLSNLEDVKTLTSKLPNLIENYIVPDPNWSHNDYAYGKDAPKYVNPKILDLLNRFNL